MVDNATPTTPARPIRFLHRSQPVEVQGLPPTTTVLNWLREHARCTGTKEGCNEGDCGACMVAVAELDANAPADDPRCGVRLSNLNACLLFLPTLDGRALFTVDDLAGGDGALHPVQQALVDHHGSQCGFCTPGFVMTIWTEREQALCRQRQGLHGRDGATEGCPPDRQQWADALAGNLCRCTGYRPILDAAQAACEGWGQAEPRLDWATLAAELRALRSETPADLHYTAHDPALGATRCFDAPRSAEALANVLAQRPEARVLGGATDIALWVNKGHRDVGDLVWTGQAQDLQRIEPREGRLCIGAAVTLEEAWPALCTHWPALEDLWRRFASPPVRRAGTLSGNVANGSPIGDAPPVLMALGAELVLRQGQGRRRVALDAFYTGYQRNLLQAGEFIEWIEIPLPAAGQVLRAWKVSKRYDSDISAVCGAFGLEFANGKLQAARLAFGGMAATVKRASGAEQALMREGFNPRGIAAAQAALPRDFQPMSDLRASAGMRLRWAQALVQRLGLSLDEQGCTRADLPALEVWR